MTLTPLDLYHLDRPPIAEKVIRKLRAGMMPPPGMPRPARKSLSFVTSLETASIRPPPHPNPGRPALHRLNRTEYANSIHDLLAVDIDVAALLPADDMSHGFDNMADVLTISPALMEGYIRAAGKISREAVGDPDRASPHLHLLHPARGLQQTRHMEGTPIGTRGGIAVLHDFPADGEYTFKLGFYYSPTGPLFGMNQGKGQQIEVAVNGERVALLEISPSMTLAKDGIKTPPIKIKAGPQRISASFPQKFDGPIEDEYRMVEQSLVDVSAGALPGMTTLPHLHEFSITGPSRSPAFPTRPAGRRSSPAVRLRQRREIPCAKQILSALARQAYRRPVTETIWKGCSASISPAATGGFRSRHPHRDPGDPRESRIRLPLRARPRRARRPAGTTASATWNWPRAFPSSCGAARPTSRWSRSPARASCGIRGAGKAGAPHAGRPAVGSALHHLRRPVAAPAESEGRQSRPVPVSRISIAAWRTPCCARRNCCSTTSCAKTAASWTCSPPNYTFVDERLAKHYGIPNMLGNRFRRVP